MAVKQKQNEIRKKLIEALRIDLIGPRGGEEETLEENPELSYLTGTLHTIAYTKNNTEFDNQEDIELEKAQSDSMGEEDNEDRYTANFKQQTSLGISFYITDTTKSFNVILEWGDYFTDKREYEGKNGKTKEIKVYTRFPRKETLEVSLKGTDRSNVYRIGREHEDIRIKVLFFSLKTGYKLVSVYASNHRVATDETANGIMFQTNLSVVATEGESFIPEYKCRYEISDEYLYESRPIFGRGHNCAANWENNVKNDVIRIYSQFIPEYEIPGVSPKLEGFEEGFFSMKLFMQPKKKDIMIERLQKLHTSYLEWITLLQNDSKMESKDFTSAKGNQIIEKCKEQADRIKDGIRILQSDEIVFTAFCFMNQCMSLQRCIDSYSKKHGQGVECGLEDFIKEDDTEWRAFQIAFILLNLPCIVNKNDKYQNNVDLLYFPTGGGKTEAYLGLMAFLMGFRRLMASSETEYNKDGGVTIILRYTLRLLTTQQRDRLTKMIIAAEIIRRNSSKSTLFGKEPFSIGFYVGFTVTPNSFDEFKNTTDDPGKKKRSIGKLNKQLINCPYCGKPLQMEDFYVDEVQERIDIYCSDENCFFFRFKDERVSIPVYLVDEQIYRECPTVVIATVDKFARLPWDVSCNALFGRVDRYCPRHGYIAIGDSHEKNHRKTASLPAVTIEQIRPFYPPELIVQDELHLITGPLGTIYGAYEAIIEQLCTITNTKNGTSILPKYIVSTATIKNADEQISSLYGRKSVTQFPPQGFDISDSFFTKDIPIEIAPFRKYCGISASGKSVKTTLLRVFAILIQTVLHLAEQPEYKDNIDDLDPYYTLVGYFNSIRELGGAVRLLQDDIPKRQKWIKKHYNHAKQRFFRFREITSRMNSEMIAGLLKELDTKLTDKGPLERSSNNFLDVAIATNMISVGLDIDRLGLMCVLGQPKQSSEYIQATSRIGRSHPGLVVTIYNPYRPRDLSHYENFKGFHSQMYRFVEGTSATPFSARSRDRTLHALFVALSRLQLDALAQNSSAGQIGNISKADIDNIINKIAVRAAKVAPKLKEAVIEEIVMFIDEWKNLASLPEHPPLYYYIMDTKKYRRLLNYYGENCTYQEKPTLNSMREVEKPSTLYYYREV
jgi:hypothetical protein